MVTEIHFTSRNHVPVLVRNIQALLKKGKTVEIHPADQTAFSKAGMVVTSLEAKCEILNRNDKPVILIKPSG